MSRTGTAAARSPAFIFAVALVARLSLMAGFYSAPVPGLARFWDTGLEMGHVAASLVAGQGFASPFGGSTGPTAMLSPGYPLIVAAVFRCLGPFTAASAWAVLGLQSLFSALTCLVIFAIGKKVFSENTGAAAAWVWAVLPSSMLVPVFRFWDTSLTALLLSAGFLLALQASASRRPLPWAWWGAFTGASGLVNPAILPCLVALAGWFWYRRTRRGLPALAPALLSVLLMAAMLAPWAVRNYVVFGRVIPLRSNFGLELWMGNHAGGNGETQIALHPATNLRTLQEFARAGELRYFRQKQEEAEQFIGQYPGTFIKLTLWRVWRSWTGWEDLLGLGALSLPLLFLGLVRLLLPIASPETVVAFALPVLIYPVPFYITHPDARFRHAIEPLLFVLAADLLVRAAQEWRMLRPEAARSAAAGSNQ